jgi:hypothetical protein
VTGVGTAAAAGAIGAGVMVAKGDASDGATGAEGGGDGCRAGGDSSSCQGRGSLVNLASFSSSGALLASTLQISLATMASMRRSLASPIVIGVATTQGKKGDG